MKKNALKVKTPPQFTKNYLSDSAREISLYFVPIKSKNTSYFLHLKL